MINKAKGLLSLICMLSVYSVQAEPKWIVLFDGQDTSLLRGYRMETFPANAWAIEDGTLATLSDVDNVDIVTRDTFESFELVYDWKVSKAGNSGLFFHVKELNDMESGNGNSPNWLNDFEIQIQDDVNFYDKDPERSAGSLYDLIAPASRAVRPWGEFNEARLVVDNGRVTHYLNGVKVLDFTIGSDELKRKIKDSKFKDNPIFGQSREGHIMFQHHGEKVWFRNIKVRRL